MLQFRSWSETSQFQNSNRQTKTNMACLSFRNSSHLYFVLNQTTSRLSGGESTYQLPTIDYQLSTLKKRSLLFPYLDTGPSWSHIQKWKWQLHNSSSRYIMAGYSLETSSQLCLWGPRVAAWCWTDHSIAAQATLHALLEWRSLPHSQRGTGVGMDDSVVLPLMRNSIPGELMDRNNYKDHTSKTHIETSD